MLLWMICQNELTPYFRTAKSIAKCYALGAVVQGLDKSVSMEEARITVRDRFNPELAEKILQAKQGEFVEYIACELDENDGGPQIASPGYFLYSTNIDWVNGVLEAEIGAWDHIDRSYFLEEEDLLQSDFEKADYRVTLSGLSFERETIEMLQPNMEFPPITHGQTENRVRIGRPRTWDWEGATTYLLTIAQTPDGLPTGPGAQAQIERLVAEWFTNETGDAPATSQAAGTKSQATLLHREPYPRR
jgi:hypothetical protein